MRPLVATVAAPVVSHDFLPFVHPLSGLFQSLVPPGSVFVQLTDLCVQAFLCGRRRGGRAEQTHDTCCGKRASFFFFLRPFSGEVRCRCTAGYRTHDNSFTSNLLLLQSHIHVYIVGPHTRCTKAYGISKNSSSFMSSLVLCA